MCRLRLDWPPAFLPLHQPGKTAIIREYLRSRVLDDKVHVQLARFTRPSHTVPCTSIGDSHDLPTAEGMPFALDSHYSWSQSRPSKRQRLAASPIMARAEDADLAFASGPDDDAVYSQNNGQTEALQDLIYRLRKISSEEIRTSDREELIQCIKRGQRPTWVPKPNLKALCAETNAEAHGPLQPAKDDAPTPSNEQAPAEPATSNPTTSVPLPEPISRPPSALHAGDFDAQPPPTDELSHSSSHAHQLGAPFHGLYASSPPPWLKLDHFGRYSHGGGSNEADVSSAFNPRPHARSRTPSVGSSLSSSFVMRAPTSPLVHATSSPASERAETLISGDHTTISDKTARRRTMPTNTLVQMSSLMSTPSSPPPLNHNPSAPYRSYQGRRSLSSFTYQPASSSQTIFPSRQRRLSHTPDASPRNHTSMIGSFEESILRGRMSTPPSKPLDFVAQIGVLGKGDCLAKLKCPAHVSVAFPAVFYNYPTSTNMRTLSDDSPSPYVGTIDLSANLKPVEAPARRKRRPETNDSDTLIAQITGPANTSVGRALAVQEAQKNDSFDSFPAPIGGAYRVPQQGQLQVVIKNPNKTAVKLFLIPYDLGGMKAGTKTFVRQRSLSSGPVVEKALSTDPERTVLDPLSGKQILRYLIHLKFCCLAKGRFYLYDNIRVVFANRVPEGKEKLRNEIQLPGPKYSTFVPGASSRRQSLADTGLAASSPPGQNSFPSLDDFHRRQVDAHSPPPFESASVSFALSRSSSHQGSLLAHGQTDQSHGLQTQPSGSISTSSQSERPQSPEFYGFDKASTSQRGSPLPLASLGQSLSRTSSPTPAASGDGLLFILRQPPADDHDAKDGKVAKDSEFAIGPAAGRDWFDAGRSTLDIDRGPCTRFSNRASPSRWEARDTGYQVFETAKTDCLILWPKALRPETEKKLTAFAWYRQIVKALIPKETAITWPKIRVCARVYHTVQNVFIGWRKLVHAENADLDRVVEFRETAAYGLMFLAHRMFEYGQVQFQSLLGDLKDTWADLPAVTSDAHSHSTFRK
ncbi:hypothetical protein DV736_g5807, partial [Chaetothyriales sp. CBS 134916]